MSVDQLLSTRQVAHKLKTKVVELNSLVQDAGKDLAEKVRARLAPLGVVRPLCAPTDAVLRGALDDGQQRALNRLEAIRRNMGKASATLHQSSTVLGLAHQVDEQFRARHYFAALKVGPRP